MPEKKIRSSNIELLRIVAMLMIIVYHILIHCINVQLINTSSIEKLQNGWFNNPAYYNELLFLELLMPLGLVGNAIFVMISGYFMAEREIDILKVSKKLLSQLVFAGTTLVLVSAIFIYKNTDISTTENLFSYIRIQYINKMSWFVGYYLIIILIAFMWLNSFLSKLDQKKYLGFLVTLLAISQLSWSGSLLDSLATGMRTVFIGLFLYAMGGYMKKYNPFEKVRGYVFIVIIVATNILIGISYHNTVIGKIQTYYYNTDTLKLPPADFIQSVPKFENYSFVVVILGICIFELFLRIKMPSLKIINAIAQATFMIYLIHDNGFVYSIWLTRDWITVLYNDFHQFVKELCICALAVFGLGLVIYAIYIILTILLKKTRFLYMKE